MSRLRPVWFTYLVGGCISQHRRTLKAADLFCGVIRCRETDPPTKLGSHTGRSRDIYGAPGWGKTRSNVSMCIIAASADDELSLHNPAIERRARFIAATADLSALGGCSDTQMNLLKLHHRARGRLKIYPLVEELLCHLCCSDVKNHDYPHQRKE